MNLHFVLIHLNEVIYFEWSKNKNILFISTNNNKLYYFTLDSCKILQLSKDFNNKSLLFSSDGKTMVIKDTNNFIMVNMENEEEIEDDRIRKGINEDYSNEHMKVEENYVNEDKDRNGEEDENELENNEEGEEMEEQMEENHSQEIKLNNNIAFEEEVGMNPDS